MQMLFDILFAGESTKKRTYPKINLSSDLNTDSIHSHAHRALQIPPEAWLRFSLNHASITWISIQPSGRVTVRLLGDSGHIPAEYVTSR